MGDDIAHADDRPATESSGRPASPLTVMPVRRDDLACHEIDGEAVLYDDAHDTTIHLNRAGYVVWQSCDGRTPAEQIARKLTKCFDVSEAVARTDVGRFLDQMNDSDLLVPR